MNMESRNRLLALIVFLLIVIIGGGTYWYLSEKDNNSNTNNQNNQNQNQNNIPNNPTEPTQNTTTVKIYFSKTGDTDCSKVYAINRTIPKTTMIGTAALNQLFKGPTEAEKSSGYTSQFSSKTTSILVGLQVSSGTAYVNLKDIRSLISSASSSCGSAQFTAQIDNTLKQFSTVKKVIYAIERDVEKFYEFIQVGCQVENNMCDNSVLKTSLVKITSPVMGAKISSPIKITGEARGTWFFEASFPIKIVDEKGKEIGSGIAQATSDWMTNNFVPFSASISFSAPTTSYGVIILQKDNPSGLPINDDQVRLFIKLK